MDFFLLSPGLLINVGEICAIETDFDCEASKIILHFTNGKSLSRRFETIHEVEAKVADLLEFIRACK